MGGRLTFGILGPLVVEVDGVATRLGGPRQRAVLALLLLEAGRVVPVGRLTSGKRRPTADQRRDSRTGTIAAATVALTAAR